MGCFFVAKNRKFEHEKSGRIKSSNSLYDREAASKPDSNTVKTSKTFSEKHFFGRSHSKDFFRASFLARNQSRLPPVSSRISVSAPHLRPRLVDGSEAVEGFSGLLTSFPGAAEGFSASNRRNNSGTSLACRAVPLPVLNEATHPLPQPALKRDAALKSFEGSPVRQNLCMATNTIHEPHGLPLKAFQGSEPQPLPLPPQVVPVSSLRSFSREEILAGCHNFCTRYLLRESEIGPVYRCSIKKPGSNEKMEAAVTRISSLNFEPDDEVLSIIETLAQVQSPYVSKLLGVSMPKALGWSRESFEWLLVSEHAKSESLQCLLRRQDRWSLDWSARTKIALGIAKGLEYLHEKFQSQQCFDGYFDLCTIQVDENFNPKLSDYSFHRLFNQNVSEVFDLSTELLVLGKSGKERNLVRNFGKVLLALVIDKQYLDKIHFRDDEILLRVLPVLSDSSSLGTILDPALKERQMTASVGKVVDLASQCLNDAVQLRPQLHKVVETLQSIHDVKHVNGSTSSKYPIQKIPDPARATSHNQPLSRILSSKTAVRKTYELPELAEHMPEEDNKIWPEEKLPESKSQTALSTNTAAATICARGQNGKIAYRPLRKHVQMPNLTCSSSFLKHEVRNMRQASLSQTS